MVEQREWSHPGARGALVARRWSDADAEPTHVVLLAHGYGEHVGRYDHVAARLVAAGAVVYGQDHVGHGKSDGERVLIEDLEDVVGDLHRLEETARGEHPGLPVVLVGHSMGGLIGARYVQRYGSGLAAVVLSGPLLGLDHPALGMLALEQIPDVPLDSTTLSRDPAVGQAYADDPLVWHGPFKRPTLEAFRTAMEAVADGPGFGDLPFLWVHGEDDQLVPVEGSRPVVAHLAGNRFEQRTYPGARHEVFNETNADDVLDDVVAFLSRVLAQPQGAQG